MEGFSALSVVFTSLGGHCSTHTIYCKAHSLKKTSERTPNGRTLFTLGWPPYVHKHCLEELFSRAGHVTDVVVQLRGGPVADDDCTTHSFKVLYNTSQNYSGIIIIIIIIVGWIYGIQLID